MIQIAKQYQNRKSKKNDCIHTPLPIVLKMIEMCDIQDDDIVLDPSAGTNKIFFNNLPANCKKMYCEIEDGSDFFQFNDRIDVIIGNPPYSLWNKWLEHTCSLQPTKFCYIFGQLNFTTIRINKILKHGYSITGFHLCKVDWWFGDSYLVLFEKNKPSIISVGLKIYCECNKRCGRSCTNSPNKCLKPLP